MTTNSGNTGYPAALINKTAQQIYARWQTTGAQSSPFTAVSLYPNHRLRLRCVWKKTILNDYNDYLPKYILHCFAHWLSLIGLVLVTLYITELLLETRMKHGLLLNDTCQLLGQTAQWCNETMGLGKCSVTYGNVNFVISEQCAWRITTSLAKWITGIFQLL